MTAALPVRTLRPLVALVPLSLVLAAVSSQPGQPGQPRPSDPAGVDAALLEARELMAKGSWKKAKSGLVDMLAAAGTEDVVVARWPHIADALAACTFWDAYEVPEARDVVPEIVSWKERSGALKLRYSRDDDRRRKVFRKIDLKSGSSFNLHPVRFTGPYSIELKGRKLEDAPVLYVDWLWGGLKGYGYGTSYAVIYGDLTGVFAFEDGGMELVDDCSTMLSYGRPYSFEVKVTSSAVTVSYNGKRQIRVKRPKGEYGQFGLLNLDSFEEVEIVGEVEPAWIAGLVQDEVLGAWNRFRDKYDPLGEAPEALRGRVAGEAKSQVDFGLSCPVPGDEGGTDLLTRAKEFVEKEEFEEGLEFAEGLGDDVDAGVRDWILANFHLYAGDGDAGYEALGRLVEAYPEFYEGRLYRAWMTRERESENDSLLEHEKLILDFPQHVEPYESLALFHLFSGRLAEAEQVLDVAVGNEVPIEALQDVGITLLRKRYGPGWPEADSYASKYYVVHSNAGQSACVRIATEMDETLRSYQRELGRIEGGDDTKFPVYFFAGEAGYQAYCKDLLGTPVEFTAGIFHPALKQLLVWDSPNPGMTMRTVRHEGFHQYMDALVGDSPVWLNEGMAEYYEEARLVGARLQEGQINEEHLALLKAVGDKWTPLETFVRMENRAFRAKSSLHYAQGWAFVHFMLNGGRGPKKLFSTLFDGLKSGMTSSEAVEAAFGDVDLRELEREFKSYVRGLR